MPQTKTYTRSPLEGLLNDYEREALINYLDMRIQSVESSLTGYREKRKKYEQQMNDNFEWRGGGRSRGSYSQSGVDDLVSGIFDLQNDTLNIVGGFAAFMTARAVDDIFGTDPFYAISPEGLADDELAQAMQKHSEWKLRKSGWKDAGLDAIDTAVGLGEAFLKSAWVTEVDVFEKRATVLVDTAGAPITTVDGEYIYEGDTELGQALDPLTKIPTQVMTVKKDPSLALDVRNLAWMEMEIEQTNVSYNNVESSVMHYGDVLFVENAPSLEKSDFFGHRFQKRLSELMAKYSIDEATLSILRTDTTEPKSAAAKINEDMEEAGEREPTRDIPDPFIEVVECWVKYDPKGDGRLRRMCILYARASRKILTMDYIANITPEGALPVHNIRAFKVRNRIYGRGYFEIYDKAQEFIDRHLNYVAYRNRFHSQPVTFMDPSLLLEDEDSEEFELVPNKSFRLKPGTKVDDFMQVFELPDMDERTWQLMQMMIQVVQVRSGVTSAAQGEVSSLPSTATATGIESILQSASTLARMPMGQMKNGLEKSLLYAIKLIYANMNRDEIFTYFEGDAQKVGTLEAAKVKDLDMNVRLLLTRFKQREQIEAGEKAITLVTGQYLPLPEPEKEAVRPLFMQVVKGLGFDQADTIVRHAITMVDPLSGQPAGQQLSSLPAPPAPRETPPPPAQEPERSAASPPPPAKAA